MSMLLRKYGPHLGVGGVGWFFFSVIFLSPRSALLSLLIIGIALFVLGFAVLVECTRIARRALRTEGEVVKVLDASLSNKGGAKYAPAVQFSASDGSKVEFIDAGARRITPYTIGEKLMVLYDPKNVQHAYVGTSGRLYMAPLGLMVIGSFVFGIGVYWYPRLVFG